MGTFQNKTVQIINTHILTIRKANQNGPEFKSSLPEWDVLKETEKQQWWGGCGENGGVGNSHNRNQSKDSS